VSKDYGQLRQQALAIRALGGKEATVKAIAKKLGVAKSTVSGWLKEKDPEVLAAHQSQKQKWIQKAWDTAAELLEALKRKAGEDKVTATDLGILIDKIMVASGEMVPQNMAQGNTGVNAGTVTVRFESSPEARGVQFAPDEAGQRQVN